MTRYIAAAVLSLSVSLSAGPALSIEQCKPGVRPMTSTPMPIYGVRFETLEHVSYTCKKGRDVVICTGLAYQLRGQWKVSWSQCR